MASLKVTIQPFEIPDHVTVDVAGEEVKVSISELDEETLGQLVEEFAASVMAQISETQ